MNNNQKYPPGAKGLLQPLDLYLNDPLISEILINRPEEIWIEKNNSFHSEKIPEFDLRHLDRLFRLIANENHQRLSRKTPLMSGSLWDGSRVQLCLPPTAKHHTLSIRRKTARNLGLSDYASSGFYSRAEKARLEKTQTKETLSENEKILLGYYAEKNWDAFLRAGILQKKNIIISGGTSSGKTTFLNACLQSIPLSDRILILEDTREIEILHENQVQLLASKGEQGEAKVTMQDLVQCCLRLRPDRIIMGEIRGAEILDFISACSTGHEGSLTSIHANNPQIAFLRMAQMYKLNNVPSMTDADILRELQSVVDVIVQIEKIEMSVGKEGEKSGGHRKVQSVYYRYGHLA